VESEPISEADPITVLFVDEQVDFLETAAQSLEREHDHIIVETATSTTGGLTRLSEGDIDCIVSAYRMSDVDGLAFLEAVREESPNLPFILLTGKESEGVASGAISAGATDCFPKHSVSDQYAVLANRIENAVHRTRTEKRFEESQRRFRTLLSNIRGMAYRCAYEPAWPMTFVSDGAATLTGYAPSTLVDGEVSYGADLIHPADREHVWNVVQDAVEAHDSFRVEYRIRTADDEEKWVWERGRGVFDDGEVVALEGFITDITERKEREQELERQEFLFQRIQDIADVGIWEYDPRTEELTWSDGVRRIHGVGDDYEPTLDEAIEFYHTDDREEITSAVNGAIEKGNGYDLELRIVRPDGAVRDVRTYGETHTDEAGDTTMLRGVVQDITERKEREEQLRQYEYAYESSLSGIAIADLDGELMAANPAFLDMWGYGDSEDIIGEPVIGGWKNPEKAADVLDQVQEAGCWEGELEALRADGSTFFTRCSASCMTDDEGEPIGVLASFVDITERKEREHQLAEEREKYSTLVEKSHDGIVIIQDEEFVFVNSRFVELIGYEEEEILGMSFLEAVAPSDRAFVRERYERRLDPDYSDPPSRYRISFVTSEGSERVAEVSVAKIQYEGKTAQLASIRDVTQQQRYKEELERVNEELEMLNRVVRHDIRNDMAIILGWTEMLDEYIDDAGQEHLEKILRSSEHIIELTEIARDYVETLSDDTEMDVYPTRLQPLLRKEVTLRQEAYPDANISVHGAVPDVEVQANEMLSSIFRNLLNNAVQHNDKETPVVEVSVEERADDVHVAVADNGPGVPESQREAIFGKGEKGLDSPGTGIGLYLAHTLVEQYGGEIRVEDNDPEGAVFILTLPKAP
jgi:PAS domain S-box-containing protein